MIVSCEEVNKSYSDCTSCSNGSKILVEENKKRYILQNSSGVCKVRIDGCLILAQDRAKCDFMVIICDTKDVYFIELKGRDLLRAVEQLSQTIDYFKSQITGRVFARVVLSKVANPRAIEVDAKIVKLRKLLKQYGGNLAYSSGTYEKDNL